MFFKGKANLCSILGWSTKTDISPSDVELLEFGENAENFEKYINIQVEWLFSSLLEQIPNTEPLIALFKKFHLSQLLLFTMTNNPGLRASLSLGETFDEVISWDVFEFVFESINQSSGISNLKNTLNNIKPKLKEKFGAKEECIDFEEMTLAIKKFELNGEQASSFKAAADHFNLQSCNNIQEIVNEKWKDSEDSDNFDGAIQNTETNMKIKIHYFLQLLLKVSQQCRFDITHTWVH